MSSQTDLWHPSRCLEIVGSFPVKMGCEGGNVSRIAKLFRLFRLFAYILVNSFLRAMLSAKSYVSR